MRCNNEFLGDNIMAYLGRRGALAPVSTADIPDNSITSAKIVDGAVAVADLGPDSVDSSELVDGSIDTSHIADDQVTGDKLANDIAISTTGAITTTGAFTSVGIDDNADALAMTIDANENVCIGVTAPTGSGTKFQVKSATDSHFRVADLSGTVRLSTANDANNAYVPLRIDASTFLLKAGTSTQADAMSITADANVGIGVTDTGDSRLHVNGRNDADGYSQILQVSDTDDSTKHVFIGYDPTNDYGEIGAVDAGTGFKALRIGPANVLFPGNVGCGTDNPRNILQVWGTTNAQVGITRGGGSEGEGAVFFYDDDADGSGSLQQDNPDVTGAVVSGWNLDLKLRAGGNTDRFTVHSNGNATLTGTLSESDERLKENIADITNPIQSLNALTGKTFTWKPELDMPEGTKYGFIAQEVEKVLPDLVESSCGIKVFDKDGKLKRMEDEENTFLETDEYAKSIQINGLIPILVEAVKELSAKNDTLETKVTALESA